MIASLGQTSGVGWMLICSCQASTTDSLSFSFFSSLEEEGLSVSQPPQSHQQERIGLRQLELNPGVNPSDTGGGGETHSPDDNLKDDSTDGTREGLQDRRTDKGGLKCGSPYLDLQGLCLWEDVISEHVDLKVFFWCGKVYFFCESGARCSTKGRWQLPLFSLSTPAWGLVTGCGPLADVSFPGDLFLVLWSHRRECWEETIELTAMKGRRLKKKTNWKDNEGFYFEGGFLFNWHLWQVMMILFTFFFLNPVALWCMSLICSLKWVDNTTLSVSALTVLAKMSLT